MTPEGFRVEGLSGSQGGFGNSKDFSALSKEAAEAEAALVSKRTGQEWKAVPIGDVPFVTNESALVKAAAEGEY